MSARACPECARSNGPHYRGPCCHGGALPAPARHEPYGLRLGRERTLLACASLADASRQYRRACWAHAARTGQGASTMPEGRLYDLSNLSKPRLMGRVSWNGRVWANKPWDASDVPLYDPSTETAPQAQQGAL